MQFVPANQRTVGDPVHRWYQEQLQINGGTMDMFTSVSNVKGLTMAYYPTASLPVATKLKGMPTKVTMLDHFFHAAFGGSFLNHIWLVAAASPVFPNAPTVEMPPFIAVVDTDGKLVSDGAVTPDGYVVNTAYTVNAPHPA